MARRFCFQLSTLKLLRCEQPGSVTTSSASMASLSASGRETMGGKARPRAGGGEGDEDDASAARGQLGGAATPAADGRREQRRRLPNRRTKTRLRVRGRETTASQAPPALDSPRSRGRLGGAPGPGWSYVTRLSGVQRAGAARRPRLGSAPGAV